MENKYRIYDKDRNVIDYVDVIYYKQLDNYYQNIGFYLSKDKYIIDAQRLNYSDNVLSMQYVGLEDKNGKKVYRLDIIDCFSEGLGYVDFKKGCFGIMFNGYFIPFCDIYRNFKVVGNLCDSIELIKDEDLVYLSTQDRNYLLGGRKDETF